MLKNRPVFTKKLGFNLFVKSFPKYARFECPDGESTFSIHKVDDLPKGNGIRVYFEDENLKNPLGGFNNQ